MDGYVKNIRSKIGHDMLILVGAGVIPVRGREMLLQMRRDNGLWADHGGCVEVGERVEDAASRELLEETGLTTGELELAGVYSGPELLYTYPNGDRVSMVVCGYVCRSFSGELRPQAEEVLELRWFSVDEPLPALSPPSVMFVTQVAELLRGEGADKRGGF